MSAVGCLRSFVASVGRRRGGGEDPWLCGTGFRRVYRGPAMRALLMAPYQRLSSGSLPWYGVVLTSGRARVRAGAPGQAPRRARPASHLAL